MKVLHFIAFALLIVGGLNWLLVGLFEQDIVDLLNLPGVLGRVIYLLVGISAIVEVATHAKSCRMCGVKGDTGAVSAMS